MKRRAVKTVVLPVKDNSGTEALYDYVAEYVLVEGKRALIIDFDYVAWMQPTVMNKFDSEDQVILKNKMMLRTVSRVDVFIEGTGQNYLDTILNSFTYDLLVFVNAHFGFGYFDNTDTLSNLNRAMRFLELLQRDVIVHDARMAGQLSKDVVTEWAWWADVILRPVEMGHSAEYEWMLG